MHTDWDKKKEYENFLSWAFGLKQGGSVGRYGDPAQAANTDSFCPDNLERVKAATAYAMMIYWNDIVSQADIPQSDHDRLRNYVKDVIDSLSLDDVSNLIVGFKDSFVERYYESKNGSISFREPNNNPL